MSTVFLTVVEMSLHGSVLILAAMLLRAVFRRAPKGVVGLAWALAAVRLVCPFVLTSPISLMPNVTTAQQGAAGEQMSLVLSGEVIALPSVPAPDPAQPIMTAMTVLWCLGILAMIVYTACAYRHTYRILREAVCVHDNVYECDRIPTPFIFGLLRPRIFLPSSMDERDKQYVIAHERAHLSRLDHWWKPLGFAVLTLHWFNPLVWLAFVLFCRDMEMACDERVLQTLGADRKKAYADALINCAAPSRRIAACPLAFGETDVRRRVHTVLRYKKPAVWLTAAAVLVCVLMSLCFLTDPQVQAIETITPAPSVPDAPVSKPNPSVSEPTLPVAVPYTQHMEITSISPQTATAGEQVTVQVTVEDTRGVESGAELLFYRETEDGEYLTVGQAVPLTLVEGDATDGLYEAVVTVPEGTTPADYRLRVSYIPNSEKPAICSAYTPEEEAALVILP